MNIEISRDDALLLLYALAGEHGKRAEDLKAKLKKVTETGKFYPKQTVIEMSEDVDGKVEKLKKTYPGLGRE